MKTTTTGSLAEFVLSRSLGDISLGLGMDAIQAVLGEPEDVGSGVGRVRIHRYFNGMLEISFLNNWVVLIALYLDRQGPLPKTGGGIFDDADILHWVSRSREDIEGWITACGLAFQTRMASEDEVALTLENGVTIGFREDRLFTVQVSERG